MRARRRGRRIAVLAGLLAVAVAAGVVAYLRLGGAAEPGDGVFAMTERGTLVLMHGSRRVAAVSGGPGWSATRPAFTEDGAYAFAYATDAKGTARQILTARSADGSTETVACSDCGIPVAAGGSRVAYLDREQTLKLLDLSEADDGPDSVAVRGLQPTPRQDAGYRLLAGVDGYVLAQPDRGTGRLHLIGPDGVAHPVTNQDTYVAVAAAGVAGSKPVFAVDATTVDRGGLGTCPAAGVSFVDAASGRMTPAPAFGEQPGPDTTTTLTDLWWDADGALYAQVRPYFCRTDLLDRANPEHTRVRPETIWRLAGDRWVRVDSLRGARWVRQIDDRTQVVGDRTGRVIVQDASQATTVTAGGFPYIAVPRGPALRLDHPPCDKQLFTAPTVIKQPQVLSATCQDGYAHVTFTDTAFEQRPSRAVLFAAAGTRWHPRAAGTAWDGRFRDADYVYFELDQQDLQARFPALTTTAAAPAQAPVVTAFVGVWHGDNDGRLEVRADGTADVTYTPGRFAAPGTKYTVRLRFVAATRNSAVAEATDGTSGVAPGSRYMFGFQGDDLTMDPPQGYATLWTKRPR